MNEQTGKTVMRGDLTVESRYRDGLPLIPQRMTKLPVDRGYPVPWFVTQLPDGSFDFRVADGEKWRRAVDEHRCWLCGEQLGRWKVFVLGPMCTITRTTSEPPSHQDCARFAVVGCPFLTQQETGYREGNLPDAAEDPGGYAIKRQPGVAALWWTDRYQLFGDGKGKALIEVGEPDQVEWWSHGRLAFLKEVHESIRTGFPLLFELAQGESLGAVLELNRQLADAMRFASVQVWKKEEQ